MHLEPAQRRPAVHTGVPSNAAPQHVPWRTGAGSGCCDVGAIMPSCRRCCLCACAVSCAVWPCPLLCAARADGGGGGRCEVTAACVR